MIFDDYRIEKIDDLIKQMSVLLKQGARHEYIKNKINIKDFDEFYDIALAKNKNKKIDEDIFFRQSDLRFATNSKVAAYRAERLKCDTIIEIGCGIGVQSIAFARACKKVIAVEIDSDKLKFAKANAKKLGITNIEFVLEDGLEFLETKPKADIIFCDPERVPHEEIRDVNNFSPNIPKLVEIAEKITKNIALELPPHIQNIPFDCEKEFISVDNELNRLTVYFGSLEKCKKSAVLLPQNIRLESKENKNIEDVKEPKKYLYEINEAAIKANIKSEICEGFAFHGFITTDNVIKNPFIKNSYHVLDICEERETTKRLKENDAKSVVLRGPIDPKKYWDIRKLYEKELKGKEKLTLFLYDKVIIAERVDLF